MRECLTLGSTPCSENCAQIGAVDYHNRMRLEIAAYIAQLNRYVKSIGYNELPEGAVISSKGFPHDFGTYHEVVVKFDDENEKACDFAFALENSLPEEWDDEARAFLKENGYKFKKE